MIWYYFHLLNYQYLIISCSVFIYKTDNNNSASFQGSTDNVNTPSCMLTPVLLLGESDHSVNISVTPEKTVQDGLIEALANFRRNNRNLEIRNYILEEQLFDGMLGERQNQVLIIYLAFMQCNINFCFITLGTMEYDIILTCVLMPFNQFINTLAYSYFSCSSNNP